MRPKKEQYGDSTKWEREKTERGKGEWRREDGGGNSSREEYNGEAVGHVETVDLPRRRWEAHDDRTSRGRLVAGCSAWASGTVGRVYRRYRVVGYVSFNDEVLGLVGRGTKYMAGRLCRARSWRRT